MIKKLIKLQLSKSPCVSFCCISFLFPFFKWGMLFLLVKMVGYLSTSWPALPGQSHSAQTLLIISRLAITQPRDELFFTEKIAFFWNVLAWTKRPLWMENNAPVEHHCSHYTESWTYHDIRGNESWKKNEEWDWRREIEKKLCSPRLHLLLVFFLVLRQLARHRLTILFFTDSICFLFLLFFLAWPCFWARKRSTVILGVISKVGRLIRNATAFILAKTPSSLLKTKCDHTHTFALWSAQGSAFCNPCS